MLLSSALLDNRDGPLQRAGRLIVAPQSGQRGPQHVEAHERRRAIRPAILLCNLQRLLRLDPRGVELPLQV